MRLTTREKNVAVEFELIDEDGERMVKATVTDRRADARTVELLLGDWHPDDPSPTVRAVTIRAQDGLCSRDIRVPLGGYIDLIAQGIANMMELSGLPRRASARRHPRVRREITDEFLADVANTYRSARDGERLAAVQDKHHGSKATVSRWLRAARERGILTDGSGDPGRRG